jgi:hypothetical protein
MAVHDPKAHGILGLFDPTMPLLPVLQRLRQAGVEGDAVEIVSALPMPGEGTSKPVHLHLYLITVLAGLVGIAVGIFFAGATAAFYPLMTGGKAIVARPVVGIVSYETMMLLGIVVTFLVMVKRILFGYRTRLEHEPRVEEGLVALVVALDRQHPLFEVTKRLLQEAGAQELRVL